MADASWLIVVFYQRGIKSHIADLFLGPEAGFLILLCSHRFGRIRSPWILTDEVLIKIKHTGKISVISDKLLQLSRLFIKYLAYGKSIVLPECFVPHLF